MTYLKPITILLLCLPLWSFGQLQVLSTSTQSAQARIDLAAGTLTPSATGGNAGAVVSNLQVAVENGDLVITYQLPVLEKDHFFEIIPAIKLEGRRLLLAADEFRGDLGRPVTPGARRIVWLNPLERYVNLAGQLEIELTANEWGELELPYDCALGEPSFTGKQKLPYVLAAGVGAAGIGIGQLIKKQSEDTYQDYLNSETLAEAAPLYEDANNQNHTYLILTYAGAGILVADAVLYLIRNGKYKRDLKNYETYCKSQTIGLQPLLDLPTGNSSTQGSVGLKMTLSLNGRR